MKTAVAVAAFFVAMLAVGLMRMGLHGSGGALVGIVQVALFFGLPALVYRALLPRKDDDE